MRTFITPSEFEGAAIAARDAGPSSFMISPGDIDPPQAVFNVLTFVFGSGHPWYPVVGNHESETPEDMACLRSFNPGGASLPHIVKKGPGGPGGTSLPGSADTCYSLDWGRAHFAVINEYFDGSSDVGSVGEVGLALMVWLQADLAATTQQVIFVSGHEPAYPQPDAEPPHRLRHETASLNQFPTSRDPFWDLLGTRGVKAHICGPTHDYSVALIDAVWQIDSGTGRATWGREAPSCGPRSTRQGR